MMSHSRQQAGERLAEQLTLQGPVRVFAVPGGGVLVALPIAHKFQVPLEVLVVHRPEGALQPWVGVRTPGGVHMLGRDSLEHLLPLNGTHPAVAPSTLAGCTAVLVDDGMNTGNTLLAAVQTLWFLGAKQVWVAVTHASREALLKVQGLADGVRCLHEQWDPLPEVTEQVWQQALQESR